MDFDQQMGRKREKERERERGRERERERERQRQRQRQRRQRQTWFPVKIPCRVRVRRRRRQSAADTTISRTVDSWHTVHPSVCTFPSLRQGPSSSPWAPNILPTRGTHVTRGTHDVTWWSNIPLISSGVALEGGGSRVGVGVWDGGKFLLGEG